MNAFKVIIPARFASTRLPGKPLRKLAGRPMLQHVYECARRSDAEEIVIATDDERIATAARSFGAVVCMTSAEHTSGTERLAEVVEKSRWDDDTLIVDPLSSGAASEGNYFGDVLRDDVVAISGTVWNDNGLGGGIADWREKRSGKGPSNW